MKVITIGLIIINSLGVGLNTVLGLTDNPIFLVLALVNLVCLASAIEDLKKEKS